MFCFIIKFENFSFHEWQIFENSTVWKDKLPAVIGKPWIASSGREAGCSCQAPLHTVSLLWPRWRPTWAHQLVSRSWSAGWQGHRSQPPLSQAAVYSRGPHSLGSWLSSPTAWSSFYNTVTLPCSCLTSFPLGGDLTSHGQRLHVAYRVVSTVRCREGRCNLDVIEGEHARKVDWQVWWISVTTRRSPPHPGKTAFCPTGPHIMLWWKCCKLYLRREENESSFSRSCFGFSSTGNNGQEEPVEGCVFRSPGLSPALVKVSFGFSGNWSILWL